MGERAVAHRPCRPALPARNSGATAPRMRSPFMHPSPSGRRQFMQTLSIGAAGAGALLACRSQPSASTRPPPEPQKPEVQPSAVQPSATQLSATQKADGQSYAPKAKPNPVVKPGEFVFAAAHLDHGHINGQCNGLTEAGATLKWVYDADPKKV